jgi:hypothetical protein
MGTKSNGHLMRIPWDYNGNRILGSAGLLPSSNNHIINPHVGYFKHNMSISAVYARSNRHLISAGCSLFFLNQFLYVENKNIWVGFPIFLYIKHSCSESKAGHLKSSYAPTRDAWDKRLKIGNWMDTLCSDKSIYGTKAQKKSLQQPTSSGIEYWYSMFHITWRCSWVYKYL